MKNILRLIAFCLAAFLTATAFVGCGTTTPPETEPELRPFETTTQTEPIEPTPYVYEGFTDIPLVVIKINYAPAGEDPVLLKQKDDRYFYNMLFGDGDLSMRTYYDKISNGQFHFVPAPESYVNAEKHNVENDGIIEVTVKQKHPGGTSRNETAEAFTEAAKHLDLASFDKDGDRALSKQELAIAFITAGYERTRSGDSLTPNTNAFYIGSSLSANGITASCGFVKIGEMMNNTYPITVGSFCHELSHFLGAVDLYTNKNWGYANSPAGKVSVMAGNGSAGKSSGELTGARPSYLDAYHLTALKFMPYTVIGDGEYTLYSRQSTEGEYGILKIETPNPQEYYLIENRYYDNETPHFDSDTNFEGTRGVIIWHVDEKYALASKGGSATTGGNNGADIGVAALAPRKEGGEIVHPASSGVFGVAGQVFKCEDYEFPLNGTWNTSEGEVWNEFFGLRIEILTDACHEMQIRVSGTKKGDFPIDTVNLLATSKSISVKGKLQSTHGMILKGITLEVSDKWDYSEILQSMDVAITKDGVYGGTFENLESKTLYFTRTVYHFDEGDFYFLGDTTTRNPVDGSNCVVSFFRGLQDNDKAFEQKVKPGTPIVVKFPMAKDGYVFGGWYRDLALTKYYEVSDPCEGGELVLFARWIEAESAAKLTVKGATLVNDKANPAGYAAIGETFRVPVATTEVTWYADAELTIPFDFSAPVTSAGEVIIYAKAAG